MNHGPLIFLGVLVTFVASWWGIIFSPQLQIGSQQAKMTEGAMAPYPASRPGLGAQGRLVYVANGCVSCHSQQVRQDGYTFDVVYAGTTNQQATTEALKSLGVSAKDLNDILAQGSDKNPVPVKRNISSKEAANVLKALTDSGATAQTVFIPTGADMARGWGRRQSVAQDYLYEYPVQIGNSRLGPDLSNAGVRGDLHSFLVHLYEPRATVRGSMMPAYRYLFETRKVGRKPSPDALVMPAEFPPQAGYEIVPKQEAYQLAAYLQSLRVETALFEAPMTQLQQPAPAGDTNAPTAGTTNAPAAGATNTPAANTNTAAGSAPGATNTPTK